MCSVNILFFNNPTHFIHVASAGIGNGSGRWELERSWKGWFGKQLCFSVDVYLETSLLYTRKNNVIKIVIACSN